MTITKNDLVEAISKLNDMNRRKSLLWKTVDHLGERPIKASYACDFEGRTLRITEYDRADTRSEWARKIYDHPRSQAGARYVLEIVDSEGNSIYEFPDVQGITDLFASVRAQLADVEGLIKSLLARQ